jgi:hypothetical protein
MLLKLETEEGVANANNYNCGSDQSNNVTETCILITFWHEQQRYTYV